MKRLIFMRHGYLKGKYKDYYKLKFNEFEDLLTKKVNPHLDKLKTKLILNNKTFLSNIDFIICSDENRAIETAKIVKEIKHINFEVNSTLNEVKFFEGIINKEDIVDFNNLRMKILTQLYNSNCSEKFEDVKMRFLDFLDFVRKLDYNSILCVTHGWFMRLISIYSIKNTLNDITLKEILEAKVPDFLDIIEVTLE